MHNLRVTSSERRVQSANHRAGRRLSALAGTLAATVMALSALGVAVLSTPVAAVTAPSPGVTALEAPLPNDAGTNPHVYVDSAACPGTGQCVTAGWYEDTSGHEWALIETQSGTGWTATEMTEPSGAGTGTMQLAAFGAFCGLAAVSCQAVSCPSTTSCVAVGLYKDSSAFNNGLIETLSGTTWTPSKAPVPSNASTGSDRTAALTSVSCTSATSCVAVGRYADTSGKIEGLIDVLSGTTWTAVEAPEPTGAGTGADLQSVLTYDSCVGALCVAVGQYEDSSARVTTLIDSYNGTAWTATAAPLPSNAGTDGDGHLSSVPEAVNCSSPASCVAVGQYLDSTGNLNLAFVDTLSGSTWSSLQAPLPADASTSAQAATLLGVSCSSPGNCVTVGFYLNTSSRSVGLIDTLAGGSWTANTAPEPADAATGAGAGAALFTVSCPVNGFCMTSGDYLNSSGGVSGLVDTLSGGAWTPSAALAPSNAKSGASAGVVAKVSACESPDACILAGSYTDSGGNTQGLLDTITGLQGYWLDASDGGIFTFGNAKYFGSTGGVKLNQPMVGMAATPDGQGYWLVASDGGIFAFGDAKYFGSTGSIKLNKPIVGMASTPDGLGYWLVASDGGIFTFGDAKFYGSTGAIKLNKPIVGMAATPDGKGYWLVASDGGIFTEGDATYLGSTGAIHLNKPIVGMGATPNGDGYWLVASDGGIFTFGNTLFYGSTGAITLNKPIVGMAVTPSGHGYWLVASDGGIFTFGDALFYGSTGAISLNKPIVGMTT